MFGCTFDHPTICDEIIRSVLRGGGVDLYLPIGEINGSSSTWRALTTLLRIMVVCLTVQCDRKDDLMRTTDRPSRALPMSVSGGRFRHFQSRSTNFLEAHKRFGRTPGRGPSDGTSHAKVAHSPPLLIIGSQDLTVSSTAKVELGVALEVDIEAG